MHLVSSLSFILRVFKIICQINLVLSLQVKIQNTYCDVTMAFICISEISFVLAKCFVFFGNFQQLVLSKLYILFFFPSVSLHSLMWKVRFCYRLSCFLYILCPENTNQPLLSFRNFLSLNSYQSSLYYYYYNNSNF